MTVYYLSDALGSGTGTGLSRSDPFTCAQVRAKGVGFFGAGDRLVVRPETFTNYLQFNQQGPTSAGADYFYLEGDPAWPGASFTQRPRFNSDGTAQPSLLGIVIGGDNNGHLSIENLEADCAYALDPADLAPSLSGIGTSYTGGTAYKLRVVNCRVLRAGYQGLTYGYGGAAFTGTGVPCLMMNNQVLGSGDNGIGIFNVCDGGIFVGNYVTTCGRGAAALGYVFGGDGISLHDSAKNCVIAGNRIDNCINAIHNINAGAAVSPQGVIFGNWITDCTGTAIVLEDWAAAASQTQQDWWVLQNVICGGGTAAAGWDAACLSIGHNTQRTGEPSAAAGGLFYARVRGNLFYNQSADNYAACFSYTSQAGNSSNTLDVRHNIFARSSTGLHCKIVERGGVVPTKNLNRNRYDSQPTNGWRREASGVNTNYSTLAAWQAVGGTYDPNSSQGAVGLTGDPSTAIRNARLTLSSACRGTAVAVVDTANGNVWGYDGRDLQGSLWQTTYDIGPLRSGINGAPRAFVGA